MIVDDDSTTVALLETLLELDGFDVLVVSRGAEVIGRLEVDNPDLLLMDYHLSDISGVEILKRLREHAELRSMPVVMASGMDVRDEVLEAGANEFLIKPFEPSELPVLFNKLISN